MCDKCIVNSSTGDSVVSLPPPVTPSLQTHYDELVRVIAEVGKDVKPAYTNSKTSADRLKRSKTHMQLAHMPTDNNHLPCFISRYSSG